MNSLTLTCSAAILAVGSLAGCAGGSSAVGTPPSLASQARAAKPLVCTPTVWASSLSTNAVYGYTAPSTAPCITLSTGPYNGLPLSAPIALALSKDPKWLYVADLGNDRIVVFTYKGVFVKAWTTNLSGVNYQPWGVCVFGKVVGVGNRQYNNTGTAGNAEFFSINTPNNGSATGYATGILESDSFCAFDEKGNFFVDGTAYGTQGGGQQIAYLAAAHVNTPAATLVNSGLGNASFWVGMYSRINSSASHTLSVGASVGSSTTETVHNWKISPVCCTFTALPSYTLTGYPSTTDAMYQLAPSNHGSTGTLYVADYGDNYVLDAPANGGVVAPTPPNYNPVSGTVGVTTRPTGQY